MFAAETLNEIIDAYIARCNELIAKTKLCDGIFGMGDGLKNNPLHEQFYNELEAAVREIVAEIPFNCEAYDAVCIILKAEFRKDCPDMARWMLTAAQKHAIPLIRFLTAGQRAELTDWYDRYCPHRSRLPVQKDVYKSLKL